MDFLTKKSYELRKDILEMMYKSKAGHVGGDLSVIDILTTLYYDTMNVGPDNFTDPNRDRFLLSKGHCADALFVVLGDKGFFDKQEAIDTFSQYNSKFIGHPNTEVNGIEINSGSLGHGLSVGVGMALAAKMDDRDYRTYVVMGDGEMAEGSIYEAMMASAQYKLDNLCATVDLNGLQISGTTDEVMSTASLAEKFKSFGWNVIVVADGNNCAQLAEAYNDAKTCKGKPTCVIAHTVKGKGVSFMENEKAWHHGLVTKELYEKGIKDIEEVLGNE